VFQDLMGDYSTTTNPDVVMRHRNGDATAQYALAELKGVRLVSVSETKRGVELEEATVKQITGNDSISVRAPFGRPFTYLPQFTLWMSTNHKPEIPDGSEAIWDRLRLLPFTQRFEGRGADTKLPDKLREELPGVLAWAVRGCVEWQSQGLGSSKAVDKATAEYRSETDVVDRFFDDVCVFGPEERITKKELFEAWESWCMDEGIEAGRQDAFTRVMGERGVVKNFEEKKIKGTRYWKGISVGNSPPDEPPDEPLPPKKPLQTDGDKSEGGQQTEFSPKFSPETIRGEGFEKRVKAAPLPPLLKIRGTMARIG
jgi:putative DNA primase/helicase